jgi:hypothetical protein
MICDHSAVFIQGRFTTFLRRAKSTNTGNTVYNDRINIRIPHIISATYKEKAKQAVCNITMRGNSGAIKNWQDGTCSFITAKITVELGCHSY